MKTLIMVLIVVVSFGCSESQSGKLQDDYLPTAAAVPKESPAAALPRSLSGYEVVGAFKTSAGYSRIEIRQVEADHQLNLYALEKLVGRLSTNSGVGILTLSDVNGWTEGCLTGDNLSLGFINGTRVGLCAGPVNTGLLVNGKRVLGPRLSAIENATSPANMVVKFNQLLEAMRTHGLIERGPALAGK